MTFTSRPLKERFEEKYIACPMSGCWLWTASLNSWGYGNMRGLDRVERSHRIAWQLYRGEIPLDLQVCHKCDVPSCVNPDHLYLGTQKQNMRDVSKRDRHPKTLLTEAEIKRVFELSHEIPQAEIANLYGVDARYIWAVLNKKYRKFLSTDFVAGHVKKIPKKDGLS